MLSLKTRSAGNSISIIHNMLLESLLTHQKILTVDVKERSNFSWVPASLRAVCRLLIWSSFCRQPGIPQHHGQRQLASEPIRVEIPSCFFRPGWCSLSSCTLYSWCMHGAGCESGGRGVKGVCVGGEGTLRARYLFTYLHWITIKNKHCNYT